MRLTVWFLLLFAVSLSARAQQDSLRAELDRDQVSLGDSVTLTLTQVGGANMPRPDLSPLSEDFQILGTSQRSSTRWTGGRSEASSSWVIVLEPLRNGQLTIPSLQAGDASSPALSLQVSEAAPVSSNEDVFLNLTIEPEQSSYRVGQQLRVTLALFHAIPLATGELNELEIDGARVERLDEDEVYESRRGQRVYRVIERRYAVVPERSGSLEIPSLRFSGRAGSRTSSFFGDRGRLVSARTEARPLEVERPAAGQPTIAARSLTLTDSLDQQAMQVQVGEAISREITLRAEGVHADQMPDLGGDRIDGLRSYADQPVRNTGHQRGWLQAEQRQRLAVIALEPGQYQLPAIRVEWYNVLDQRNEVAELPARTLTVLPASVSSSQGASERMASAGDAGFWPWLSLGLGLLWLATLAVMLWNRRQELRLDELGPSEEITATLRYARRQLAMAARSGDHEGCQEALMMWNRAERLGCRSLSELAERVRQEDMAEAIRQLDRARFGPKAGNWQAPDCFLNPPQRLGIAMTETKTPSVLPPLY